MDSGDVNTVKVLLAQGADVNLTNSARETVLMLAIRQGDPDIVRLLLEYGADVNATDKTGSTALRSNHQRRH